LFVEFWKMQDWTYILQGNLTFFDFLEESTRRGRYPTAAVWEEKIEERDFPFPK